MYRPHSGSEAGKDTLNFPVVVFHSLAVLSALAVSIRVPYVAQNIRHTHNIYIYTDKARLTHTYACAHICRGSGPWDWIYKQLVRPYGLWGPARTASSPLNRDAPTGYKGIHRGKNRESHHTVRRLYRAIRRARRQPPPSRAEPNVKHLLCACMRTPRGRKRERKRARETNKQTIR